MTRKISDAQARSEMKALGFVPDNNAPYPGTDARWPGVWVECGHRTTASRGKVLNGARCGQRGCAPNARITEAEARSIAESHGFVPDADEPYKHSHALWSGTWLDCGHRRKQRLSELQIGQKCGEKNCTSAQRRANTRRTPDEDARDEAASFGFIPDSTVPFPGVTVPWPGRWEACGHEESKRLEKIKAGQGCAKRGCRKNARISDAEARAIAKAWGFSPDVDAPFPGVDKKWAGKWDACGHRRETRLSTIKDGVVCPCSAESGFDPEKVAFLYLAERPGEQKVGITNAPKSRFAVHKRNGWDVVEVTPPIEGGRIADAERQIKEWLKQTVGTLPGTKESWSTAYLRVGSLADLIERAGCTLSIGQQPQHASPSASR